jgi:acyl dehydratase
MKAEGSLFAEHYPISYLSEELTMDTRQKAYFADVYEGMSIPSVTYGPMNRYSYIPIAIILRDTNPLHLDRVYARERGLPDVVQQGPLNETYLYRFLTDWLHRPWDLRKTKIRFTANVIPDDLLTCHGNITRKYRDNDEPRVDCQIWQENQKSEKILVGEATFTLPERG